MSTHLLASHQLSKPLTANKQADNFIGNLIGIRLLIYQTANHEVQLAAVTIGQLA